MSEVLGARAELVATGQLGPEGVALLYKTARQVVRMRNVPPPTPRGWTEDDIIEVAHEVFAARNGAARLVALAVRSTDEKSFRAMLWTLVVNDIISAGRRTERGKLSDRLRRVLADMPDVQVTDAGMLRRGDADPVAEVPRVDELDAALARVSVTVPTWRADAAHSAPVADRASLEALIRAALGVANGALTHPALVNAVAGRLGVHDAPDLMDHDRLDFIAAPTPDTTEGQALEKVAGSDLLDHLTVEEQLVLPYLDESVTVLAERSGLKRTRAWTVRNHLKVKLLDLLAGDPDRASTLRSACEEAIGRWSRR